MEKTLPAVVVLFAALMRKEVGHALSHSAEDSAIKVSAELMA